MAWSDTERATLTAILDILIPANPGRGIPGAGELGVAYVLEGSVRRADNQIRINAQLIDGTSGGHLWAETYDRPYSDIFALQDDITQEITTALAVNKPICSPNRFSGKAKGAMLIVAPPISRML